MGLSKHNININDISNQVHLKCMHLSSEKLSDIKQIDIQIYALQIVSSAGHLVSNIHVDI